MKCCFRQCYHGGSHSLVFLRRSPTTVSMFIALLNLHLNSSHQQRMAKPPKSSFSLYFRNNIWRYYWCISTTLAKGLPLLTEQELSQKTGGGSELGQEMFPRCLLQFTERAPEHGAAWGPRSVDFHAVSWAPHAVDPSIKMKVIAGCCISIRGKQVLWSVHRNEI